jgi:hypothetical protein
MKRTKGRGTTKPAARDEDWQQKDNEAAARQNRREDGDKV